jgi:hypothetical protein
MREPRRRYAEIAEMRAGAGQPVKAANPDGSTTSGNGHHHPLRQPISSECPVVFQRVRSSPGSRRNCCGCENCNMGQNRPCAIFK